MKKILGPAILILMVALSLSALRNVRKIGEIRGEIQKEKDKIARIEEENRQLEQEIIQGQGVDFIEKELRDKLGLVKEGEVVVVLPDEETLKKFAPNLEIEEETLPDPNWKKWMKLFI